MAGKNGAPYRPPCSGWPKPVHFAPCFNHKRKADSAVPTNSNLTKVSGVPPVDGDPGPPDACDIGETLIDQNCYAPSGDTHDFSLCHKQGWKAVQAYKMWHGRFGFLSSLNCQDDECPNQEDTKYTIQSVHCTINEHIEWTQWTWPSGPGGNPVIDYNTRDWVGEQKRVFTVDTNSGIVTLSDCIDSGDAEPTDSGPQDIGPGCSGLLFAPFIQGGDTQYWTKILANLNYHCFVDDPTYKFETGILYYGTFPNQSTLAELEAWFEALNPITGACAYQSDYTTTDRAATITVDDDTISIEFAYEDELTRTPVWNVSGVDIAYLNQISTVSVVIQLSGSYTFSQVCDDLYALLGEWDMANDVSYPWRTDINCDTAPMVIRKEVLGAPQSPLGSGFPACDWEDPQDAAVYDGTILGSPLSVPSVEGHYQFRDEIKAWTPSFLPKTATYWTPDSLVGDRPQGAWLIYDPSQSTVFAQKWAAIKGVHLSYNFFRPCGADRDAIDQTDPDFCANQEANTPVYLFPDAWPICGRIAITAASNASPIVLTLAEPADWLRDGDLVDVSGVTGNTAANVTSNAVTKIDTTHFSLDSTTGNGDYVSGGFIKSSGAPDYQWHDDQIKGDYIFLSWEFDLCDGTETLECNQRCFTFSPCHPSVACISPNDEHFEGWDDGIPSSRTEAFPDPVVVLDNKGTANPRWQGICRFVFGDPLWQPLHEEPGGLDCDGNPVVQPEEPLVEARCAPPDGAPALPDGYTFGCPDATACGAPADGACSSDVDGEEGI